VIAETLSNPFGRFWLPRWRKRGGRKRDKKNAPQNTAGMTVIKWTHTPQRVHRNATPQCYTAMQIQCLR